MQESKTKRLVVYTDGSCPFCQWSRTQVERFDQDRRVEFRDYNLPAAARETPFSHSELAKEMHVLSADKQWSGGFFAWLQVLKVLPRWCWLGKLLSFVPFRWIGPPLYRLAARNRYRVPSFVLHWMGAPPPCPAEGSCPAPKVG